MAGVQSPTVDVLDAIERARQLQEEGRLDEALSSLLECALQNEDESLAAEIASIYTERGRKRKVLEEALRDFGEARSWSLMPGTLAAEAAAHLRHGDSQKAETMAKMALEADPEEVEAHVVRAHVFIDAGRLDGLNELLVGLTPDIAGSVYVHLGEALRERGQVDQALHILIPLRDIRGGDPEVHAVLARCHADREDYPEARKSWLRATEVDPGHVEAWRGLATASAHDGEELDMVRAVDRAVELDREGTLAWLEGARRNLSMLERYEV